MITVAQSVGDSAEKGSVIGLRPRLRTKVAPSPRTRKENSGQGIKRNQTGCCFVFPPTSASVTLRNNSRFHPQPRIMTFRLMVDPKLAPGVTASEYCVVCVCVFGQL